jgi:monoamine oxidase
VTKVNDSNKRRALIIGGSLGGLFAGNLLHGIGWDVEIFERSARDLAVEVAVSSFSPRWLKCSGEPASIFEPSILASDPSTGLSSGRMARSSPNISPHKPRLHGRSSTLRHSILNLLHQAAGAAEKNSQHALDMAQKLSHQLRAAEQRIADLEAEAERHRDRAERAEQWLHRVYTEIEERFLRQVGGRARTMAP